MSEHQTNMLIAEANYAFRMNMYLFEEIGVTDPYPFLTFIRALFKVLFGFIGGK